MRSLIYRKVVFLLNLLFFVNSLLTFSQTNVTEGSDMKDFHKLKSGSEEIEKPQNMLQRNCTECHTGIISYYIWYNLPDSDSIRSNDKFSHTWLVCTKNDTSKEIQIFAKGIRGENDTVPVKNALLLVAVQRYFGWMFVNTQPLFTDESGMATCKIPGDIKGDSTGRFKILIKLADDKSYPNGKLKISLPWGEPVYYNKDPGNSKISAVFDSPFNWLSVTSVSGSITICIIISYVFYLIFKMKKKGKETKPL